MYNSKKGEPFLKILATSKQCLSPELNFGQKTCKFGHFLEGLF